MPDQSVEHEQRSSVLRASDTAKDASSRNGGVGDIDVSRILPLTEALFPDAPVTLESQHDPSCPETEYVVLYVHCKGDAKTMLAKERKWIRRVEEARIEAASRVRLVVCPM